MDTHTSLVQRPGGAKPLRGRAGGRTGVSPAVAGRQPGAARPTARRRQAAGAPGFRKPGDYKGEAARCETGRLVRTASPGPRLRSPPDSPRPGTLRRHRGDSGRCPRHRDRGLELRRQVVASSAPFRGTRPARLGPRRRHAARVRAHAALLSGLPRLAGTHPGLRRPGCVAHREPRPFRRGVSRTHPHRCRHRQSLCAAGHDTTPGQSAPIRNRCRSQLRLLERSLRFRPLHRRFQPAPQRPDPYDCRRPARALRLPSLPRRVPSGGMALTRARSR